ncbi:hypothetical protein C2845_PM01G44540 [Panicum miliaceum]|uniref:Uncharacterized protein n=1 Tax=Panicum miliaceum TaxID=4540 RepID=A0A3L6TQC4_PANMI|nr:hypothetical protein C2845_PM01G44540 [Panicum miliaceum]
MNNGIRIQVIDLNTPVIKKATEEIRGGEGQSPFNKMFKEDGLIYIFLRNILVEGRFPMNHFLRLKKALSD